MKLIGRDYEIAKLEHLAGSSGGPRLLAVYGPRRVGITALLLEFTSRLLEQGKPVLYVDAAAATETPLEAVKSDPKLVRLILSFTPRVGDQPLGPLIALYLPVTIARALLPFRDRGVLVIVDHVDRGIGIGRLVDYLDSFKATLDRLAQAGVEARAVVALTPLAAYRIGNRYPLYTLWGLDRKAYGELLENLRLSVEVEEAYRLTGGNPGETVLIATRFKGSLSFWLDSLKPRVRKVIRLLEARGIMLKKPPTPVQLDTMGTRVLETLQAYDITMWIGSADNLTEAVRPDPDRGIGAAWAWQLPAYYHLLP